MTLRADPQRYDIAYFFARKLSDPDKEDSALAVMMVQAKYGERSPTADETVITGILEDRKYRIPMAKPAGRGEEESDLWRDRHYADAQGANFVRKISKLVKKLERVSPSTAEEASDDQKDVYWLGLMAAAWRIAIGPYSYVGNPLAAARKLATKAGEVDFFERVIVPTFIMHEAIHPPTWAARI